jgi:hypothetical protein
VTKSEIPVVTFFVDGNSAKKSSITATNLAAGFSLQFERNLLVPFIQEVNNSTTLNFMPLYNYKPNIFLESGITIKDIIFTKNFSALFTKPQKDEEEEKKVVECIEKMIEKLQTDLKELVDRIKQNVQIMRTSPIPLAIKESVELSFQILSVLYSLCPPDVIKNLDEKLRQLQSSTVMDSKLNVPMKRYEDHANVLLSFTFDDSIKPFSLDWTHFVPNFWNECVFYGDNSGKMNKLGCFKGPSFIGIRDRMHTGGSEYLPFTDSTKKFYIEFRFSTNQSKVFESPFLDDVKIKALYRDTPFKIIQSSDIRKN